MRRMREQQGLAYSLAVLIGTATNNPKKFPKFAEAFPDPRKPTRRKTPEEMLQAMRAWSEAVDMAMRH